MKQETTIRNLGLAMFIGAALVAIGVPVANALPSVLGLVRAEGYAITCGGNLIADGGPGVADGGYPVTNIAETLEAQNARGSWMVVGNPAAAAVYVGGSDVQPDTGFPICSTATSCADTAVEGPLVDGSLYCTGTAATEVRVLTGKHR